MFEALGAIRSSLRMRLGTVLADEVQTLYSCVTYLTVCIPRIAVKTNIKATVVTPGEAR
jgi:hypothetical protein